MTSYCVTDGPKMLRETLCIAQVWIGRSNDPRREGHIRRIQRLINECDRHRPTGPDGKHGDRHTATCGCDPDMSAGLAPIRHHDKCISQTQGPHDSYCDCRAIYMLEGGQLVAARAERAEAERDAALARLATARADALRDAARELEAQPPKLRAQYVSVLQLYASEPWRLPVLADPEGGE